MDIISVLIEVAIVRRANAGNKPALPSPMILIYLYYLMCIGLSILYMLGPTTVNFKIELKIMMILMIFEV